MEIAILFAGNFFAALISGAAGFGGSLLLLPIVTACIGTEVAVPVLIMSHMNVKFWFMRNENII